MEKQKISDADLAQVSGGGSCEDEVKKYQGQHGIIIKDALGNVTFTDKTGKTGTFSAADWAKLSTNWAYTQNPEFYMSTINNDELAGVLKGMR